MQMSKLNDWLQLLTSIGVLIGLFLVAIEIRQNNELARAETTDGLFEMWESISQIELQSGIKDLFVKSIEQPSELTTSEIMNLDSWLINLITIHQRQVRMYEYGLASDPTAGIRSSAHYYFVGAFARAWLEENRGWIIATTPSVYEALREEIESTPAQSSFGYVERIKSRLRNQ